MAHKNVRRSLTMSQEMHDLLAQLVAKRGRDVTEADLIREAIRQFLDEQSDLVGSKRHFQKSLQQRLDRLEASLAFYSQIVIYLLGALLEEEGQTAIHEAIIAARRDGADLASKIEAVRAIREKTS